jgi:hypothetical protein
MVLMDGDEDLNVLANRREPLFSLAISEAVLNFSTWFSLRNPRITQTYAHLSAKNHFVSIDSHALSKIAGSLCFESEK